ncbi:MAG: hypothetical protein GY906_38930, partial [bacterium]|nr:hypothetical protein [bacterium]
MPKKRKNRINPLNSRHLDRLQTAVFDSRRQLEPFRQNRIDAIREMIGQNYSDEGTADRVPVNFIEMAVNTYARQLVANNPKVLITTKHRTLKPEAHLREVVVNNLIKEMHLAEVLYEGVIEALFCMGIVKTGVVVHDVIEIAERFHDLTQPFCDVVNLDDWVHDMSCRTYEAAQYSGNRYRLPLEMAKEMEIFDKKEREKLVELEERRVNEQGDERSETLSQGDHQYTEEYKAHCEFWDIWLPQENMLLTFPGDTSDGMTIGDKPLRTVEWDGPEDGPYHLLRFGRVPGNMMPLAPVMTWKDLAYIGTKLFNKMTNQAERQKTLGFFQEGKSKTAERIKDAIDGEVL